MLRSMTGFGLVRAQDERWCVTAEVRSVNNRHFKLAAKVSEPYAGLEPELERLVRESVQRGTVTLSVRVERPKRPEDYRLNTVALASYREQLKVLGEAPALSDLLGLPGVVEDRRAPESDPREDWPALSAIIAQALAQFQESRSREGKAMGEELERLLAGIAEHVEQITGRVPESVSSYRDRLLERIKALVQGLGATVEPGDLVREVALYVDRSDVSEELTRLRAHIAEFRRKLGSEEPAGRGLEFLAQEMGREANTLGSKSSDVEISRRAIEIKGLLESIREIILNVE